MVASSRRGLGESGPLRNQWNEQVTRDTLFHAAIGSGDDNPLWIDADHARNAKWGRRVAPPSFVQSITYGTRYPEDPSGSRQRSMLSGLPGIGSFWLGSEITWNGPLLEGDSVRGYVRALASIDSSGPVAGDRIDAEFDLENATRTWRDFIGPWTARTLLQVGECTIFREPQHELAIRVVEHGVRMPRGLAVREGRYANVPTPQYSEDDLREIFASYAAETRRGSKPLLFDQVEVGDELPHRLRGPLTVTSMRAYGAACGSNFAMGDGLLFRYLHRFPGANAPHPDTNVPDVPNRIHWDTDLAETLGLPRGYDFGPMRLWWFGSWITDWIGDGGYLHQLSIFFSSPMFLWDIFRMSGRVVNKEQTDRGPAIDIEFRGEDGSGQETTFGSARAIL
jgi:acyl dehydratase